MSLGLQILIISTKIQMDFADESSTDANQLRRKPQQSYDPALHDAFLTNDMKEAARTLVLALQDSSLEGRRKKARVAFERYTTYLLTLPEPPTVRRGVMDDIGDPDFAVDEFAPTSLDCDTSMSSGDPFDDMLAQNERVFAAYRESTGIHGRSDYVLLADGVIVGTYRDRNEACLAACGHPTAVKSIKRIAQEETPITVRGVKKLQFQANNGRQHACPTVRIL